MFTPEEVRAIAKHNYFKGLVIGLITGAALAMLAIIIAGSLN